MPGARTRVAVARVALLFACGQQLEGPRVIEISIDGDDLQLVKVDADGGVGYSTFAADDIDLDGDDDLLVRSYEGIRWVTADGVGKPLLEIDEVNAWWFPRPEGTAADLFVESWHGRESQLIHAACDLGEQPRCATSGTVGFGDLFWSVAVGDFDEDGARDVVAATDSSVEVYLATGDDWRRPSWAEPRVLLATGAWERSLATVDLDGDAHIDIAAATGDLGLRFFFGTGDGSFAQVRPAIADALGSASHVRVVDTEGRGVPELLVHADSGPVVLRRLRGRVYGDAQLPLGDPEAQWWWPADAVAVDFDGDGADEILLVDSSAGTTLVKADATTGAWTSTTLQTSLEEGDHVSFGEPADLDGDGRQTLAAYLAEEMPMECTIAAARPRRGRGG